MFTTVKRKKIRMMGLVSCVKRRTSYGLTYSMAYSGYAFGSSHKNNYMQSMEANATTNVFKRFIQTLRFIQQRNLIEPALYTCAVQSEERMIYSTKEGDMSEGMVGSYE